MRTLVTTPMGWSLLLALAALAAFVAARIVRSAPWTGRLNVVAGTALAGAWIVIVSAATPALSHALLAPLERVCNAPEHYPSWARMAEPEAIVVLGGGLQGPPVRGVPLAPASLERVHEAVSMAQIWSDVPVLFSGGSDQPRATTGARRMSEEAIRAGLSPQRVLLEERARTTRGNGVEVAAWMQDEGIERVALVTSAPHMRRSLGVFQAVGVDPLPVCASPRTISRGVQDRVYPDVRALYETTIAVHELLGYEYYRLQGWVVSPPR
jgi:uncharacterized SAM-binding protein YcdF (DUF218 family)